MNHPVVRSMRVVIALLLSAAAGLAPAPSLHAETPRPQAAAVDPGTKTEVNAVTSVGFTVLDLDRETAFFTGVLGFVKRSEFEVAGDEYEHLTGVFGTRARIATLTLGDEVLELTQYLAPEGRPVPPDSRSNDRWFQHIAIAVSDIDAAYKHLREHNVRHASAGPQTLPAWNTSAAGISAFYFKDPEGHVLEVIHFPAGKGDPRWQQRAGSSALFLGIDHTALVVEDTDTSLKLYRDVLGLRVAGGSENYGTEQEHLNNVFGARLRITTLRARGGPGVELLEYLAPRSGRPYPADSACNDAWHWQVRFAVASADSAAAALIAGQRQRVVALVSPGTVHVTSTVLGFQAAVTARDPDGHAFQLAERATDTVPR